MREAQDFAMVGLTGSIASGKSLVAGYLQQMGVALVDADILAREIVEPGEPAWEDIRLRFGEEVINADQTIDRGALGAQIFADASARRELEAFTHPRIAQRLRERAEHYRLAGEAWMVYDAALLVENNAHTWLNALVVVAVDPQVQRERLMRRDGLSVDEAQQRIDSQMSVAAKVEVADFVIDNNGTREETRAQVDDVLRQLKQRFDP